jgi:large subunit ribosomal protein L19
MSYSRPIIQSIEEKYSRSDLPEFRPGDKVRVHALISEGNKERIQVFEGTCIHKSNRGLRGSFTVRKISDGVGVERVWPSNSPRVTKVELVSRGNVSQAKLYYLRERSGKSARIKEHRGAYAENVEAAASEEAASEADASTQAAADTPAKAEE